MCMIGRYLGQTHGIRIMRRGRKEGHAIARKDMLQDQIYEGAN